MKRVEKAFGIEGFSKQAATIKGAIGEKIVRDIIDELGYTTFEATKPDKSHPIDFVAFDGKLGLHLVEVKTKVRREKYPDTGVDYYNFMDYVKLSLERNTPCWIYFVDTSTGTIYGNTLKNLMQKKTVKLYGNTIKYPACYYTDRDGKDKLFYDHKGKRLYYFHIDFMEELAKLTPEQIAEIKKYEGNKNKDRKY